jgi:hypothetical protein
MTRGHNDEEFLKPLDTALLASPAMLVIDMRTASCTRDYPPLPAYGTDRELGIRVYGILGEALNQTAIET